MKYKMFKEETTGNTPVGQFKIVNNHYVIESNSTFAKWVKRIKENVNGNKFYIVSSLYECYGRPSDLKERIYNDCYDACSQLSKELVNTTLDCFGIYSYNCMQFTFLAWDSKYIYYITKTKNIMIER